MTKQNLPDRDMRTSLTMYNQMHCLAKSCKQELINKEFNSSMKVLLPSQPRSWSQVHLNFT